MSTVIWTLSGAVLGAGCGWGAICWCHRMLKTRSRDQRVSPTAQRILVIAAALCGGVMGLCTGQWLPMAFALGVLTVSIAVAAADWLCRIIPNPTVLAILALKLMLMAAALLNLPGAVPFSLLPTLGAMVLCFLLFSAPGLMGKRVGSGDIKLAAAMGFLLEFNGALLAVGFMGLLILGYCMLQQKMPLLAFLKTNIPMGPFIAAGMMLAFMVPFVTA